MTVTQAKERLQAAQETLLRSAIGNQNIAVDLLAAQPPTLQQPLMPPQQLPAVQLLPNLLQTVQNGVLDTTRQNQIELQNQNRLPPLNIILDHDKKEPSQRQNLTPASVPHI